jgi:hypothetical protein
MKQYYSVCVANTPSVGLLKILSQPKYLLITMAPSPLVKVTPTDQSSGKCVGSISVDYIAKSHCMYVLL